MDACVLNDTVVELADNTANPDRIQLIARSGNDIVTKNVVYETYSIYFPKDNSSECDMIQNPGKPIDTGAMVPQETIPSMKHTNKQPSKNEKENKLHSAAKISEGKNMSPNRIYYCYILKVKVYRKCMICLKDKSVKYSCTYDDIVFYICGEMCLRVVREHHSVILTDCVKSIDCRTQNRIKRIFVRNCKQCSKDLNEKDGVCSWEEMEFCNESCLWRCQKKNFTQCAKCWQLITFEQLGKYAVRLGSIIRQYCSGNCIDQAKGEINICSYCQKISPRSSAASTGRFYCNDTCRHRFESLQKSFLVVSKSKHCSVCSLTSSTGIECSHCGIDYYFCSSICYTSFQLTYNHEPSPIKCCTCSKFVFQDFLNIFKSKDYYHFCSKICRDIHIIQNRKVVECIWCKVNKNNFDMIQKNNLLDNAIIICSLYCLRNFTITLDVINEKLHCKMCYKKSVYSVQCTNGNLKMFCSLSCIASYQSNMNLADFRTDALNCEKLIVDKLVIMKSPELPKMKNIATSVCPVNVDKSTQTKVISKVEADTQGCSIYAPISDQHTVSVQLNKNSAADVFDVIEGASTLFPLHM